MNCRPLHFLVFSCLIALCVAAPLRAQDTVVVQTLTFDSAGRAGYYHFPDAGQFEKVIMQYTMRCKHALISQNHAPNDVGCGEWDYNCETYIWDSTRTDSLRNWWPSAIVSNYPQYVNFPYTTKPTTSLVMRDEKIVTYNPVPSFPSVALGTTGAPQHDPIFLAPSRAIYILSASELAASGLKNDTIVGLRLDIQSPQTSPDSVFDLRIRMHPATGEQLLEDRSRDTNFLEVYHAKTLISSVQNTLFFYRSFVWDGKSDIVLELSCMGFKGAPITLNGGSKGQQGILSTAHESYSLSFGSSELLNIRDSKFDTLYKALGGLSNEITIAFWAFGDTTQLPGANTVVFEGLDTTGNRQLNIHLPWSDGNVYWDCGGDFKGNYDRISVPVSRRDAAGRWNYWAFTKNAITGRMAIYLNGALVKSDTGKHLPIAAQRMTLGGAMSSSLGYFGELSQFVLYNRALDSGSIENIMGEDHSYWITSQPGLLAYYTLAEGSGSTILNWASGGSTILFGTPVWRVMRGNELHNGFYGSPRPDFTLLEQASPGNRVVADRYVYDTIPDHAQIVTHYAIGHNYALHANDSAYAVDTIYGDYLAGKSYTFDEQGKKVDSLNVPAQDTVRPTKLYYTVRSPQKYELMSFVTPYGIFLDLGKTGKTWEFDVTDYSTVLKGWKRLSMERGSGQEEFDLKFLFIKGTPTRRVLDMQQVWPMTEEGYATIQSDARYEPRKVYLNPLAKGFKIRSYITGHGQEGEFIGQTHYISVNSKKYERLVWKECSNDPLYPQGGTWPLNRSGWCPGMATDLAEYEITGTVNPGDSVTMDYGVEGGSGDSRYDPSTQLVTYGAPNFTHDAAITDIQRPSDHIAYGRINPACDVPIIVIRNNGSAPLTSLQFEYYVDNGPHKTYNWTGNLKFLDTLAVALPVDSLSFWTTATSNKFHVDISKLSGSADEYDPNNHYTSNFTQPPAYNGIVVVNLITNKNPEENRYEILDKTGNTVFSNDGFTASTTYYDSLILSPGCYTMLFHDDGEDGLYFPFPWDLQGSGTLRFRQTSRSGKVLKTFEPNFGKFIQYDFTIGQTGSGVGTAAVPFRRVSLYPNPAESVVHVELDGYPSQMIMLEVVDERGNVLRREQHATGTPGTLNWVMKLDGLSKGNYFMRITTPDGSTEKGFAVQ